MPALQVADLGAQGEQDDFQYEIGSSLIKQEDINKVNSFNAGSAPPWKLGSKNLITDYNVPSSGTPLDNELRADSKLQAIHRDPANGASSSMKIVTYPDQSK